MHDEALALLPEADRRAQKPGLMMAQIYRTLLREIEVQQFQVLQVFAEGVVDSARTVRVTLSLELPLSPS